MFVVLDRVRALRPERLLPGFQFVIELSGKTFSGNSRRDRRRHGVHLAQYSLEDAKEVHGGVEDRDCLLFSVFDWGVGSQVGVTLVDSGRVTKVERASGADPTQTRKRDGS